ncbi:MFS transporter [Serinicoccus sp. LYQ131]|uniref:MFS transporter n=1 Tax=Serinicoccus sp. LYQ131 TaxID=3378797 RepID=UPI003851C7E3
MTSWGVMYYAFPVALASVTADTGWSAGAAMAAFSTGLVTSAVAGVPVGRWLDRWGPRPVMTGGSCLAVVAMVGLALSHHFVMFLGSWVLAGLAMAAVFYQPAFAALTEWFGPRRVRALTLLTLVASLASTVFAPLTQVMLTHLDWRSTYLCLAGLLGVVTVPLHLVVLARPWRADRPEHRRRRHDLPLRAVLRRPRFVLLSGAMAVTAFGLYAASMTLIPLLTSRGLSASLAALAFGLIGAGQLLGRAGYAPLAARTTPPGRTSVLLAGSVVCLALLAAVPGPAALLVVFAMLLGAVRGAATLLQATLVADVWGTESYGTLSGWFAAPITTAAALAPWAGTALAQTLNGYPAMLWVLTALALSATVAVAVAGRRT